MKSKKPNPCGSTIVWGRCLMRSGCGWLGCWRPRRTGSCSEQQSMKSATESTAWEPRPFRQPPTSGKKRGGYEGASLVCPHCAEDARFVKRREKSVQTLMGPIELRRPYYHCAGCHCGTVPWDRTLGLNERRFTCAAQELVALVGTLVSFPKGSNETLRKLSGLRVSESTVQRTTEDAGARLRRLWDDRQTLGASKLWDWQ